MEREPINAVCRWVRDRQGDLYRPVFSCRFEECTPAMLNFFYLFVGLPRPDMPCVLIMPENGEWFMRDMEIERCFSLCYLAPPKGFVEFYTDRLGTSYGVADGMGAVALRKMVFNEHITNYAIFRLTERLCKIIDLARRLYTTNEFTLI